MYTLRRSSRLRDTEGRSGGPFACRSTTRSCYAHVRFCSPLPLAMNVDWHDELSATAEVFGTSKQIQALGYPLSGSGLSAEVLQQCIPWGILIVDQQRRILF